MEIGMKSLWRKAAPFAAMTLIECGEVVMTTLAKEAMDEGISNYVFMVYYSAVGVLLLLPYFIIHIIRKKNTPITYALLKRCFILGLFGRCLVLFSYVGIEYTSPALTAAMGNLTPVYTFLLAVIFRMETIELGARSSQAKCLGTIVAVSGAFLLTLYKGPAIFPISPIPSPAEDHVHHHVLLFLSNQSRWVLGGLFLAIGYFFTAAWSVLQAQTVEKYGDKTTIVFYFLLFGAIQCTFFSSILERDLSAWILHQRIQFIAIAYSAIFGVAIRYIVMTWCLKEKGPLFVALFKPLGMVIAQIGGICFLGDTLRVGSLIGAVVIAGGFYTVMWGRAEEERRCDKYKDLESSTQSITPLLSNNDEPNHV